VSLGAAAAQSGDGDDDESASLAAHPIAEKLNRAWMAVAHKPV
jgi:hypothetical protein